MLFSLFLARISFFYVYLLFCFSSDSNNVTNPSPTVESKVINIVISLVGAPIAETNNATVTLLLVTEE